MAAMDLPIQDEILVHIPVKIEYQVLNQFLRQKLIGEKLGTENQAGEETNYAEVLDLTLVRSEHTGLDLSLRADLKALTTFLKNKRVSVILHFSLVFDEDTQEISVGNYKLEGNNQNWLLNKPVEMLANKIAYKKLKEKMKLDFSPIIGKQLHQLNEKMNAPVETVDGIFVTGQLKEFKIKTILPGDNLFMVWVAVSGFGLVDVRRIDP